MIKLWHQSKACAIDVSNYMIRELNELLDKSDIIPAVNQVEFHPWANAHRIEVEEEKPDKERGYYLHPDLYSQQKRIE